MPVPEPLTYRDTVRDEWIDYNGHLSEPYYVLVFGDATTNLMERVGLGAEYRRRTGSSLYTVEAHVRYLREVERHADLLVHTRVVSTGTKKARICHEMYTGGTLVATEELLAVHVTDGRGSPLPGEVQDNLRRLVVSAPDYAGRAIYG